MRVNKIVPFSVVILLITVSFAGVAAVSAQPTPTQLSVAANVTTVPANTPFTINGTLNATGGPGIANAPIQLQNSTDNATWNNVTPTTATDANGNYSFSNSESANGTYYYRTTFAGIAPTYGNATSPTVIVTVTKIATQLSAAANLTTVPVNAPFTINGTLNTTSGTPIAGATIALQNNSSGSWTDVATNVTDTNGAYSFSTSEPVIGTYYYQTTYAGNALESNATSPAVTVLVNTTSTQLTAVASPNTTLTNQNFTISGTLNDTSGHPIAGATITLQNNSTGSWNPVNTTTTNATGGYQFSLNESTNGTYYYRTTFAGSGTALSPATSPSVTVQVVIPTTLTALANVTAVETNQNFTINGTLNTTSGTPIAGATIALQNNSSGSWTDVATNVTDTNGAYSFSTSEPVIGTYYYQTTYAGNALESNATSPAVTVLVNTTSTQLTAVASPNTTLTNQNFTISGTLNDTSGHPIAGATITLQNNSTGSWNPVNTTTTNATGGYQFSLNESTNGTYYYRTTFAGIGQISAATSNVVNVTVGKISTQLSAVASPTSVAVNAPLTINGTLLNATSGPIAGATIQLQWYSGGTWTNVTGETNNTTSTGTYSISTSGPAVGTYQYQTIYEGNTTYANATSPTVTVQVVIPTTLTAVANVTTVAANTPFTINGTLNFTSGTGIAGATIQLQKNVSGTWTNVATNVTDANGTYQFNNSESAAGTYQYQTTYAGDAFIGAATSPVVTVTVGLIPTTLTAAANVTTVAANTPFTINGTLNATSGPIAGATIQLQKNVSGTWQNVTGKTNTTTSTGAYSISTSEPTAGAYQYRTTYVGNVIYSNATSNVVSVNVTTQITPASSPAVTAQNANSLYLFVRGSDNALWYKYWTGTTWTTATSLGGVLAANSSPAVTSPTSGAIDVFVQGTNGAVYEKTTTNNGATWSGWTSLGGGLAAGSSPAATSPGTGQVDISVLGTGNVLWWKTTTNSGASWSGWMSVGGI